MVRPIRHTRIPRAQSKAPLNSTQIYRTSQSTRTRSPTARRASPAASSHSACQNKHRFRAWVFKRNIRLSFALRSEAAQLS